MLQKTAGPAAGDGGPERMGSVVEKLTPIEYPQNHFQSKGGSAACRGKVRSSCLSKVESSS